MSAAELTSYDELVAALKVPLPETIERREELRQMIAYAESWGVIVSEHRRKLLVEVENRTAIKLQHLKDGVDYNEKGELDQSKDRAEQWKKLNADEKKIMLAAQVSTVAAELDFVTNLENLIKRRTSLGQTILNSINLEVQSTFNK